MTSQQTLGQMIVAAQTTKDKLFYAGLSLFSQKGYANVGIRELCRTVNIKESSFYNHFHGKEDLLDAIFDFFNHASNKVVMPQEDIDHFIQNGDVHMFFVQNMYRIREHTSNVLYHTALQIVLTESYLHKSAAKMAKQNLYHLRRDYTEKVLRGLMERGAIIPCDVEAVTAEYYYALKGMLDEYLLLQIWGEDMTQIEARIIAHIRFFTQILTPAQSTGVQPRDYS